MFYAYRNKFLHTLLTLSLVFGTQVGRADDTEIYFSSGSSSSASSSAIRPNVLFILDTSGSMGNALSGDPEGRTRIQVLRESMAEIIADIQNVNLGLMRFTYNDGGPVLFPITYIDETIENVVGEELGTGLTFSYERVAAEDAVEDIQASSPDLGTVTTSNAGGITISKTAFVAETVVPGGSVDLDLQVDDDDDDAEEDTDDSTNNMSNGQFGLNSSVLKVDPDNMVGLRFSLAPGDLAMCTEIDDANLYLRVYDDDSGSQEINVWAQDSDSTAVFVETHQGLSSRPDTSAVVVWDPPAFDDNDFWTNLDTGQYETVTRLEDVIEEVVNRGCSAFGANDGTWDESTLVIFMEQNAGSNDRDFYSHDESSSRAPRLLITSTSAGGTIPEQAATESLIAVRFEDIDIPEGANVTAASLKFIPYADGGTASDNTWRIYGEKVANSTAFTGAASELSTRFAANPTTAFARWDVPAWTENAPVETTNTDATNTLEGVLEEITADASGWCGGNDITLFIYAEDFDNLRIAKSLEDASDAFTLEYTYDSALDDGCYQAEANKQLEVSQDDAQQDGTNALADVNENTIPITQQTSGFRFSDVMVPVGATIISATINFTSASAATGATDITIYGEISLDNDADEFQYALDNISNRLSTVAPTTETWTLPATLSADQAFSTPDLVNIVQDIVDDSDWASNNAMAFIFDPVGSSNHTVWARDGSAAKAATLSITYESDGTTITKTARERMIELVEQLPDSDHTPILDVLYEAAHYWRGESIVFGKNRWGDNDSALSHPGSYCSKNADATFDCNGATIDATTNEFGVLYESGCNPDNEASWESNDCDNSQIKGNPSYISPFDTASTCQANYQIFLTDGDLYDADGESATEIASEYSLTCLANNSSFKEEDDDNLTYNASGDHVEKCAVDLAAFLNETDQIPDSILDNDQTVQTSTVAFDLSGSGAQYMKDIANKGGGDFYEANSATDLVNIFQSFLESVRDVPTSFVAPSLATNAFNRLLSRDEVYFGLFTPELDERWDGNIKKYNICVDTTAFGGCTLGEIIDADGNSAIDDVTERFDDEARSIWTATGLDDGGNTTVGGAGAEITAYAGSDGVVIYTEVGGNSPAGTEITSGNSLDATGYVYDESTTGSDDWAADDLQAMRALVCDPAPPSPVDLGHADSPNCEERMKWLLGKKIVTDPESDINANQRWTVSDVLHSSPVVITYGGSDVTGDIPGDPDFDGVIVNFFDKLIYGTNDGSLHMINGNSGEEDWRFIPNELMQQQRDMYVNAEGVHVYGMDVTPTVRIVDHNSNGVIEIPDSDTNNDSVIAYMAMRRGGNQIYALDLSEEMSTASTIIEPKYLWQIEGGSGDFSRLGQTWSRPMLASIATTTGRMDVLIFGGGYDDSLDDAAQFGTGATGSNDNMGNAIYIVNALTGDKVLSIAGNSTGGTDGDIEVANMKFSISSRITVQDSNADGIDDRLYVGDTGGQVWRVDLGNDIIAAGGITAAATCQADTNCNQTIIGRLATVSDSANVADYRRFYEPPSVIQVLDTQFASGIGNEYDYILIGSGYRAHPLNEDTEDRFYAFRDIHINGLTAQTGLNLAADYPKQVSPGTEGEPISHATANELINITTQTLQDAVDAMIPVEDSLGWYFDFNESNTEGGVVTEPGEKVLSAPITIAGTVFFTTYLPTEDDISTDVCVGAQIGSGRAYNLDVLSAKSAIDWDGDGDIDLDDRSVTLGGGIPSDVVPVFTKEGVVGIVGIEGGATQLGTLSGLPRFRTYWYEE